MQTLFAGSSRLCRTSIAMATLAGLALLAGAPVAKAKAGDDKPQARTMTVSVVGPDGKPLAGAKIHAGVWTTEPFQANRDYVCGADGNATVELPKTVDILRLWARSEAHVSLFAQWWPKQEPKPREIPREFTFHLEKGTTIGGVVKN
jgi:hypothetical protein